MYSKHKQEVIKAQFPVLYHGSDERVISMPEEERKEFLSSCWKIAEYVWQYVQPFATTNDHARFKDYMSEHRYKVFCLGVSIYYHSRCLENPLFEYDALYLTSFEDEAWRYAHRAHYFGEAGFVAYAMTCAALSRGLELTLDESMSRMMDSVVAFAEGPRRPVVIAVDQYDPDLLKTETGEELIMSKGVIQGSNFRYLGKLQLNTFPTQERNDRVLSEPWLL